MRLGLRLAINVATGLIASVGVLRGTLERTTLPHVAQAVRDDCFRTLLQMADGQHTDVTLPAPPLAQGWQIAKAKSGVFFALVSRSGARLGGATEEQVPHYSAFGLQLGLLMQIGNDLDGLANNSVGRSDLVTGPRWTLPVAFTMAVASVEVQAHLRFCLATAAIDTEAVARAVRDGLV